MEALRIYIPGAYEDAFLYMDNLIAVGTDRALLSTQVQRLIGEVVPAALHQLATLHFARNDLLKQDGTQLLLSDVTIRDVVHKRFSEAQESFLADPETLVASAEYESMLGPSTLLDLQIYNQRVFAGTTSGLIQADLFDDDSEIRMSRPRKRTDARCVSLTIRYGALAASCEDAGLLVSFDEFGELVEQDGDELKNAAPSSLRASWLGYNLINYSGAAQAVALRATYEFPRGRRSGNRGAIVTKFNSDPALLASEVEAWQGADYAFNDHSMFFIHQPDGAYELRHRTWRAGRLGRSVEVSRGTMAKPLSANSTLSGLVVETYDSVWLATPDGFELLHPGEVIAVRTFPSSVRYQNIVVIIDEEGLHLVSPLFAQASA